MSSCRFLWDVFDTNDVKIIFLSPDYFSQQTRHSLSHFTQLSVVTAVTGNQRGVAGVIPASLPRDFYQTNLSSVRDLGSSQNSFKSPNCVVCGVLTVSPNCVPLSPVPLTSEKSLTIPRDYQLTTLVLTNNATINKVFSPLTFACFQVTKIEHKHFQTDLSWPLIPGTVHHIAKPALEKG